VPGFGVPGFGVPGPCPGGVPGLPGAGPPGPPDPGASAATAVAPLTPEPPAPSNRTVSRPAGRNRAATEPSNSSSNRSPRSVEPPMPVCAESGDGRSASARGRAASFRMDGPMTAPNAKNAVAATVTLRTARRGGSGGGSMPAGPRCVRLRSGPSAEWGPRPSRRMRAATDTTGPSSAPRVTGRPPHRMMISSAGCGVGAPRRVLECRRGAATVGPLCACRMTNRGCNVVLASQREALRPVHPSALCAGRRPCIDHRALMTDRSAPPPVRIGLTGAAGRLRSGRTATNERCDVQRSLDY
jgi:hypothetical protein